MNTKETTIKNILNQLKYIVDSHLALEENPICIDNKFSLTPKEIHIIQAIGENREMNIKELGAHFGTSKSAASQMITKLFNKGLIRKENPTNNNKELKLFLTTDGQKAFDVHNEYHNLYTSKLIQQLGSKFATKELSKTSELLKIVENIMKEKIPNL